MKTTKGFTMVESLIVIAVTSALLFSALAMINGRQARTQFSTGVRELEALLSDSINDVSYGILPDIPGLSCDATAPGAPQLTHDGTSGDTIAKNDSCVLAGKVIWLGSDANNEKYTTFSVAGRRLDASGDPVRDYADLFPTMIHPLNASGAGAALVDSTNQRDLPWGMQFVRDADNFDTIAFALMYREFRGYNVTGSTGQVQAGKSAVGLLWIGNGATVATTALVNTLVSSSTSANFINNGDPPITLCFKSQSSNQFAVMYLSVTGVGVDIETKIVGDISSELCSQ